MAITPEQIVETAEALVERGESPTLAAVRRELGGGSYTTISEALKGWRERRQAARARAEVIQVPGKVQEALAEAGKLVWTEAIRQHAAQLAAEREALDAERQRFEAERREAVELADQVSRDLDQVRSEREQSSQALTQEYQAHDQTRAEAREQHALAEERNRRSEAQEEELREMRRQAGESSAELGLLRGQLEALRGQIEDLRAVNASIEVERDQARATFQEAQGKALEHIRRIEAQDAALDAMHAQVDETAVERAHLAGDLEKARQEATEAAQRVAVVEAKAQHQGEALEDARVAQAVAERTVWDLRLELATLGERAAHVDDLRAIIARMQATQDLGQGIQEASTVAPTDLVLESAQQASIALCRVQTPSGKV